MSETLKKIHPVLKVAALGAIFAGKLFVYQFVFASGLLAGDGVTATRLASCTPVSEAPLLAGSSVPSRIELYCGKDKHSGKGMLSLDTDGQSTIVEAKISRDQSPKPLRIEAAAGKLRL